MELAESQELVKCEVCEDLLQELGAVFGLRSTACPFLVAAGTPFDVVGEVMCRVQDAITTRGAPINQQQLVTFEGKIPWDV